MKREGGGFTELRHGLEDLDGVKCRVGWFESAHYTNGMPVAEVAAIQEYGAGPIPPRSFMRTTLAENGGNWMQQIAQGSRRVIEGKFTAPQMFEIFGLGAAGDIAKKIAHITQPRLADATLVMRKNDPTGDKHYSGKGITIHEAHARVKGGEDVTGVSTKPLVWSGQMIQSITAVVDKAGGK